MALFVVNGPRRQRQDFANVTDALQRFEAAQELLELERARRYYDPPPPYPSSGETTQPPSPGEAPNTDEAALQTRRFTMLQSIPRHQFHSQTIREDKRLVYQIQKERYGRRQTLPYDETADLKANAENNVRARWVEQGIWQDEWGPAWPKGAEPSDNNWCSSHKNTRGPYICTERWGHEKRPEPQFLPEPAPEPEATPFRSIFAGMVRKEPDTSVPDVTEAPAATSERDTSASRPYHQFLFQLSKECEWITDELEFQRTTGTIDINAVAYDRTKKNWIEDRIWNPAWGELPGMTWMHEDLKNELEQNERRTSKPQPDAVRNDDQTPRLPSPRSFNSVPDAPSGGRARAGGKKKRLSTPQSAEVPGGRVLRSVRSSRVMKPSTSTERPIRTTRRSSLGRAGSGMPSAGVLNNTRQRRPTVKDQPITTEVPRRSERIAAQMRNKARAQA